MTILKVMLGLWGTLFAIAIGWGLYGTWRERRADSRSSLRLVQRFRQSKDQ